eukprot:TRINITY_DN15977_c0_g1_i1.p1 TRINITY_DN15977_c0_g1~~TRINITY_DN15977_c0_g1_i1.p1  ORF type:complete len:678 (+),score=78.59 TRINITY_DN15977_c0_g1_i1:68-2101(+)
MGGGQSKREKQEERAARYSPRRQFGSSEIGFYAQRGCTDLCGFLIYAAAWILMMTLAFAGYSQGDPNRLLYGLDRAGNLCGHHAENISFTVNITRDGKKLAWSDLDKIAYPIPSAETCAGRLVAQSGPTCEDLIKDSLKLGLCVDKCPDKGDTVLWYDGTEEMNGEKVSFDSPLETKEVIHRCIPAHPEELTGDITNIFGIAGTMGTAFAQLRDSIHVVGLCAGATVLISYLWLFILRRTVKPTVFISLILLFFGSGFITYICYSNWDRSSSGSSKNMWLLFLIATAAFFVIYTLLCVFFCKNINVACDTIEEASKIPITIPTMTLVPPCIVFVMIPVIIFHIVTALFIQTIGDLKKEEVVWWGNVTEQSEELGNATQAFVEVLGDENWRIYAHLYNLFMLLWSMALLNATGFMILAFCAVFWYWSVPGDHKQPQGGVAKGLTLTIRYHLGTVMIGSLIVAIIQLIRIIMQAMEERMRRLSDSDVVTCFIKCVQCCLACFERLIKFINRNAYIMTAMCGDNFCSGAKRALFLLMRHAFDVIAVNFIADWVMLFGKLQIVALSTALGWLCIVQFDMTGDNIATEDCVLTLIVIAIIAYIIASIFAAVFSVCVDTVLLSFCQDLDVNNGKDKPYYLPSDLQDSLDKHNVTKYSARPLEPIQPAQKMGATPLEQPLMLQY